jgi:hypothetical protein
MTLSSTTLRILVSLCWVSFILSVSNLGILSVVMLSVIMLSVAAPISRVFLSLSQKTIDLTILKQMKTKRTKSGLARSQKQKKKRKK